MTNSWTLQLPIHAGTSTYTLLAYENTGAQLGSLTVTGRGGIFPAGPGNLVVSELHYNPAGTWAPASATLVTSTTAGSIATVRLKATPR